MKLILTFLVALICSTFVFAQTKRPFSVSAGFTRAARFERKIERSQFLFSLILNVPIIKKLNFVVTAVQPLDFQRRRFYSTGVVYKIF